MNTTTLHCRSSAVSILLFSLVVATRAAEVETTNNHVSWEATLIGGSSGGVPLKSGTVSYRDQRSQESAFTFKSRMPLSSCNLTLGATAQRLTFSQSGSWTLPLPKRFRDDALNLTVDGKFSGKWSWASFANVGWRSAGLDSAGSAGFGAMGGILGFYRNSDAMQFSVGVAFDTLATGSNRAVPLAGLEWQMAPDWKLALGLPRTGLFWTPLESLEIGLVGEGVWTTYEVAAKTSLLNPAGLSLAGQKLELSEARAGIQLSYQMNSMVRFGITAGVVGLRRFDYPERHLTLKTTGVDGGYLTANVTVSF